MPRNFNHLPGLSSINSHLPGLLFSTISVFSYLLFCSMTHLQLLKPFHATFWNWVPTPVFWILLSGNYLLFTQPSEVMAAMSCKALATRGLRWGWLSFLFHRASLPTQEQQQILTFESHAISLYHWRFQSVTLTNIPPS